MEFMFSDCDSLRVLDIHNFNTAKVTIMSFMFSGCSSLTGLGASNLDISHFNTAQVKEMWGMFKGCSSLQYLNLSSFDTRKVKKELYMEDMFKGCERLSKLRTPKRSGKYTTKLSESKKAWKDKKGKKYRFLPKNSKKSIILTK